MSLFEAQVAELRKCLSEPLSPVAPLDCGVEGGNLPSPQARAGLILQNESFCELAGPGRASVLSLAYSNETACEGAWRIGEDLQKFKGKTIDFGLVVLLSGKALDAQTFYQFTLRFPRLADHPGWMVKTDKTNVWIRVGDDDPAQALEIAAASLIDRIHKAFEAVETVELYFVLNDKQLIELLKPVAEDCQKTLRELKTGVWQERGFDYESCQLAGHCGSCSDKKTCASVRKIQAKVKLVRKEKEKDKCKK